MSKGKGGEVSADTLQGYMTAHDDAMVIIAEIGSKQYEVGLGQRIPTDKPSVEIGESTYAVRWIYLWRVLGSDELGLPFPAIGFSSLSKRFAILDEALNVTGFIDSKSVRSATSEEAERTLLGIDDAALAQFLAP